MDCSTPPPRQVPPACYKDLASWAHLVVGLLLAGVGGFGLMFSCYRGSSLVADAADLYVVLLLVAAAIRSDGCVKMSKFLPSRLFGLLLLVLLFVALVTSFASKFIANGHVCNSTGTPCITATMREGAGSTRQSPILSHVRRDGLYFSLVTITTVGYGDYTATCDARWLVMWELCSGALLLVLALPLLISRMATWQ